MATKSTKSPTATEPKTRSAARPAAKKAAAAKKAPAAKKTAVKKADAKAVPVRKPAAKAAPTGKPAAKKAAPAARSAPPAQPKARKSAKPALPTDIVERLRLEVRRALEELKAKDIVELDVRGKTSIADYIVVAGGTSSRHVRSIADEVIKYSKKAGMIPLGVEGQREGEWVLVDLGDIIIHVMLPRVREFYGLERLWSVGGDESAEAAYA